MATKLRAKVELRLKASHWLAKSIALELPSNDDAHSYAGGTLTLVNGDVDGDNHATAHDHNARTAVPEPPAMAAPGLGLAWTSRNRRRPVS